MSLILDSTLPTEQFTPTTVAEYLALQLAKRLGDEPAIEQYIRYAEHHPAGHLAKLFHRVKQTTNPADAFHSSFTPSDP
jgi:hypothetical protein